MKAYKWTVALVILVLALFVRPNKPNLNLSTDEVVAKTAETATKIENLIQITNSSYSEIRNRETVFSLQRSHRLEAFYDSVTTPSHTYSLFGKHQVSNEETHTSYAFLYRHREPNGWFSRQPSVVYPVQPDEEPLPEAETQESRYSAWEEKEEPPFPLHEYNDALVLLEQVQTHLTGEQTEQNYLLTFKTDRQNILEAEDFLIVREFILREWPQMQEFLETPSGNEKLRLRFVIDYRDMNLQNMQITYERKINGKNYRILYNSVFEQFNIVPPPSLPETAPELPA